MVNPARAGMILERAIGTPVMRCKPRASGDDPPSEMVATGCPL